MIAVSAFGQTSNDLTAKYPVATVFEVRPGILMIPKYAENGQVCEMTLEKRHVTPTKTDLGSSMPRELVKQLIDELVPTAERGQPTKQFYKWDYETTIAGNTAFTQADFENVSIEIVGSVSPGDSGDVVVVIHWKKRTCPTTKPSH
jgi:hypothetical protein